MMLAKCAYAVLQTRDGSVKTKSGYEKSTYSGKTAVAEIDNPQNPSPRSCAIHRVSSLLAVLTFKRERWHARQVGSEEGRLRQTPLDRAGRERWSDPPPLRPGVWRAHQRLGCRPPSPLGPSQRPPRNGLLRGRSVRLSGNHRALAPMPSACARHAPYAY